MSQTIDQILDYVSRNQQVTLGPINAMEKFCDAMEDVAAAEATARETILMVLGAKPLLQCPAEFDSIPDDVKRSVMLTVMLHSLEETFTNALTAVLAFKQSRVDATNTVTAGIAAEDPKVRE